MKDRRFWSVFAGVQVVGILCVAIGYKIGFPTVVFGTVLLMPGLWISSTMLASNLLETSSGFVVNFAVAVLVNLLLWMAAHRIIRNLRSREHIVRVKLNDS